MRAKALRLAEEQLPVQCQPEGSKWGRERSNPSPCNGEPSMFQAATREGEPPGYVPSNRVCTSGGLSARIDRGGRTLREDGKTLQNFSLT